MVDTARNIADLLPENLELLEMLVPEEGSDLICCPLSYGQQRLWFLDQLEPGSPVYNLPTGVRLRGALDLSALQRSLNEIIRRHESLRTRFVKLDGQPVQVIDPELELPLEVFDLSTLDEQERGTEALRLAHATAAGEFDLTTGPLLRATLLRLSADEHMLLLTMHHIISDGWSLGVLVREVGVLYRAFTEGLASPLPELSVQYADYAVWQREQLTKESLAEQLSYWREQLSGAPAVLGLPADHVRPAVKSYRGARERLELSAELTAALKALSREQGVTLFMVLLAAFKVLLWRYSGQEDIVVGTPIANRQQSEIEGLIGFFVNTLALRTSIEGSESFKDLLKRVREVCLGAYQHQDVPFEMVVEEMAVERAMGQTPLFQVMFAMQAEAPAVVEMKGLQVSVLEVESGTAKFDLMLTMREDEGRLSGQLEYDTDLFEAASIKRLVGHYERLLQELVRDGEQAVGAAPMLGAEERQQLLFEWNQTSAPVPDSCLHQLFEAQVERTPNAVAVIFEEQQLSYSELNRRANHIAHFLRRAGVGAESCVGVLMERSAEMLIGMLGILKAGGAYVPLDPNYPQERLSFMLEDAQAKVLLTQERLRDRLPEWQAEIICVDSDWELIAAESSDDPLPINVPDNLAYLIYTSGSTGRPKGVSIEHRNTVTLLHWAKDVYTPAEYAGVLASTSICFDLSVFEFFVPLSWGGKVIIAENALQLPLLLAAQEVTLINTVPSAMAELARDGGLSASVRVVNLAGEPLKRPLVNAVYRLEDVEKVFNLYGPSEDTTYSTFVLVPDGDGGVSIGRPVANTHVYLLSEQMQPVPAGVPAELYIGGEGLARGYHRRPELTAERFVPNPFSAEPGARLYRTGDVARYLANGELDYLGRVDHQVKIRGFRVEVGEIESVLSEHPAVRQSVTIAREGVTGDKRLVSYIVAAEPVEIGELRRHLKQKLPDYMIPSAFVLLDVLPLMPNGKINRQALPAPDRVDHQASTTSQTPIEEIITGICAHLLKCEEVSGADNFFELGGHSLLATQLISRLRDSLSLEIPVRWVFQTSTLAELAERVAEEFAKEKAAAGARLVAIRRRGETEASLPLSFAQQRLWFIDQLEPGNPVYNIPGSVRLTGPLDLSAVSQSLNEIINRHEALRTRFAIVDGQPVQMVEATLELPIEVLDLSAMTETEREVEAERLSTAQAALPFNLTTGPLLRATLLRLSAEEHVLLLTMHHIISDGWSLGVLVREVAALYQAFTEGSASPLPALPIQYADYAVWQREQLTNEFLAQQLSYWREQLSGAPAVLGLPTDYARPAVKSYRGARERLELSAELTAALKELSREQGVTLFMVLLAAFKVLLWRYSGQPEVVVGTPIANRQQSEIEGLIGFFVNTLALRTGIEGSESFKNLLKRVREVCLGAYQHQDVPFEMVVEEMAVERALNHTPIFQVMFVLQNTPASELLLEDVEIGLLEVERGTTKFDLTLTMREDEEGLSGQVEYDTDLFEGASIKRLVGHYQRLLQEIVRDGEQAIGAVPLLGAEERQQLLFEWNQTTAPVPDSCLHELFEAQVKRTPEAVAVIFEEEQLSYGALNRRANQLAHHLRGMGVGPEVLVGVLMERSVELVASLLAVLKAGGAYVGLDAQTPEQRLLFTLEDAGVKLLLTQRETITVLPEYVGPVVYVEKDWEQFAEESDENLTHKLAADNLAYVIYTSGSTGQPKGVLISHRAICNHLQWRQSAYPLSRSDRFLHKASVSFDISVWEIFGPLLAGSELLLAKPGGQQESAYLTRLMAEEKVTVAHFGPAMLQVWLQEAELRRCQDLKQVFCGGEPLTVAQRNSFFVRCQARLCHQYGPTEATVDALVWDCQTNDGEVIPLGRPIANMRAYVLDEALQPAPIGVAGELHLAGLGLARGYLKRADLTAEKFIPDPFSEQGGERLYKTGDRVRYLAEGTLEFLGRLDQQVKIRGFRIELGEIEAMLNEHPVVRQSVTIAREDVAGDKRLVSYLVAAEPVESGELRRHLKQQLPDYMIPSAFILLDALPLTANGKINHQALPAPARVEHQASTTSATPIEEIITGICAHLLKCEEVSGADNFFEIGGHSLLATQLVARLRDSLALEIPVRWVFQSSTLAELAEWVAAEFAREKAGPHLAAIHRRGETGASLPLSFAQQRLWFLDQLEPGNPVYNIPGSVRLTGPLDLAAVSQSLNEIVKRHEALRTRFAIVDGQPVQVIEPALELAIEVLDLSAMSATEGEVEAQRLATAEAALPFDLATGPLLRAKLLRLAAEEHMLLLTMHHIISDGWSTGVLVREMAALYQAFSRQLPSPLLELQIQYADYALWQRQQLSETLLDQQLTYWREQLQSAPAVLALPADRSRRPVKRYRGARETFHISEELAAELKALSRAQQVTMFMLLLAAFKVLLWRHSGQEDIVVGTPVANRQQSQIEDLVGFFVNTLALRTRLDPIERFADLLKRVREEFLAAYQHQDVPFELIVEELAVERSLSYTPIFQVMFVLQNELLVPRAMENIEIEVMAIEGRTAKVDLLMAIETHETGGGLSGVIEYDTDLFEQETVRRLAQHYQILLQAIVSNGDERVGKLPLLGEEERQRLLVTWNETQAEYPEQSVSELFEAVVQQTPENVAVVFEEQRLSYDDLNRRANQLGHYLRKLGVGPEVVVAVLAERSVETIASLLAVLKAGGVYLPLEPSTPTERLLFMMEDCGVKLLLTQQRLLERLSAPCIPVVVLDAEQQLLSNESEQNLSGIGVTPEHLAYLMYTSGSTGKPKGIGIPHRGIVRLVRGANYASLSAAEVMLQTAPVSFDASTFEIWGSLLNGGRLVLLPGERASLEELGRVVKEHQVTTLWLTTGLFQLMVEERIEDLRGLRQLLTGGDVMSVSHFERALRELQGCQINHCYGPTENTTFTSSYPMKSVSQIGATVSIGGPISNTKIYVLDANLEPVPVGVTGELYTGGDGLARGYFNQPSLTAEKFIPDPFSAQGGERLYKTGDQVRYLADSKLEFVGRMDHQVKLRGFRIEPSEIETVLAEHPAVAQCVVLVRAGGTREKTLLAYVVAEQSVSISELRTYLQARLPEYMIPTAFIKVAAIPLTAHGKVDRAALLALETSQPDATADYVGARTLVEELLVTIWANLLDVPRVGIYDNFFELGGHSLLAVRLLSRVRGSFQVEVTLHSLFETPTVVGLAEEIERQLRVGQTSLAMPIVPAEREGKLELSFSQQRLWFLNQLEPDSAAYNLPVALRLKGLLNVSVLEQSLGEVVRRHEALRTTFVVSEGEPTQVIAPALSLVQSVVDLSAETECEAEVQRLIAEEGRRPFDLAQGPLLRAKLLRLAEDEHVALFTMHHIISDGWSMGVLVQEIATLYQAFGLDQPALLPELPVQYADFAMSQREWLQGEVLEEQLSYWREQLSGAPAVIGLPTDHVRPAVKSYRGRSERFALSAELTAALKALSREQGVTLFMVLLAAFKVLLWRYSGQRDVVVGTPIANRQQSEIEGLIGFFVNTLALRTNIERSESFTSLLKRVREVCLGAYQHQDVPFEMVVEELAVERSLNHSPIFQVMFVLQNAPASALSLEDVEISVLEVESGTAKFDLTMRVTEAEGGLIGQVAYDTDLFEAGSIQRLVGHYQQLLQEIVRDAEQAIDAVPLLGAEERQQLLYDWNQTSAAMPVCCLHELFEAQVERTSEAVAVLFERQQLSYRELNQRANQLARHLRSLGVGSEMLVGVLLERSVEMVVSLLAVLKAGGAYVGLDVQTPAQRLRFMLEDAGVKLLLSQRETITAALPEYAGPVVYVEPAQFAAESAENLAPVVTADNLAYVIYTSGSTGAPKGVQITHGAICNHLQWRQRAYPLTGNDRFLHKASIGFDISVWEIFAPLLAGGQLLFAKPGGQQESAYLARLIAEEKVTVAHFGPAMLQVWLQEPEVANCQELKRVFCGGEPLTVPLRNSFYARCSRAELCHQYGPTEATVDALVWDCRADDEVEVIPLGRPIANLRAYVLDERLQPVPVGVAGELHLAGVGLARGYLQRADLTAAQFVPNPFSAQGGERLYKTGDQARYLADGNLEFLGRLDQQVKIRGFRVEVGEVETLLEQHEKIEQAVVVAREADAGGKTLVAYLVTQQTEPPATAELQAYLKQRLPEYMVPAALFFLSELPLTPSGKINRRALPEPDRTELSDHYVGPRTETEALVCSLWAGILKLKRVGIYDNFFELGGHSLLATQLVSRVREAFGVEIPLRLLFEQPTVAGFTQGIETVLPVGRNSSPIKRLSLEGPQPLSFSQRRLWFLDQLTPGSAVYNIPAVLRLSGSLHLVALQKAFNEILRRQELLRTSFSVIDAEPVQLVSEPADFDLPVVDLSYLESSEIERQVQQLASEEAHCPFDLTHGPLFRATLLRLAAAEHVLLFTMHHIISDGWSMRVLIKEVTTIYDAFSAGQPSPLTDLPVQYGDYAVWQREQLQGEILEEQLQYWCEQLQGAPVLLELPTENPRPPVQSYRGARVTLEIAPETTRALKVLSQQHSVTLFMTLLATFQVLLYRYTGQEDIVVGTPLAGRTRRETEGLIGFFLNTLALRVSLKGDPTFATLLSRVRDACLGAYAHQDVPFERLLEELAPERTLSHTPVFQVMFNMLNLDHLSEQIELDDLKIDLLALAQQGLGAKFELELYAREQGDGLQLHLVYSELYTSVAMEQLLGHLHTLLQAVAAEPGRRLSTLALSTDLREQQPNQNNLIRPTNPFVAFVNEEIEQTIQERFEKQVRGCPGNIAIKIRNESWTYKELNHKANQIARAVLAASGSGDQRIALLLNHDARMVAGILGVLKAGKTYVPLDASYPRQRLMEVLKDSEAAGLLTNNANLLFAEELIQEGLPVINLDLLDSSTPGDDLQVQCTPDSLAYILHTSGSTGKPKGVMQNHRNVLHHIRNYTNNLHICASDKLTLFSSYAVDAAVQDIFGAVLNGATLCPIDVRTEDLNRLLARLSEEEITIYHSTPTVYRYFVNTLRDQEVCPSVRLVALGGEEVQKRDFELYRQHFSPLCLFVNGLGLTESTVTLQYFVNQQTEITHEAMPVGHAVENMEVSLFNKAGEQVAPYGVGEIIIKSPHVALGYWRQPELTQKAFPTASTDGYWRSYRTGDLGRRLADGTIEYVGRRDNQVKIRGHRVELGEVEGALRTCRGVSECAVVMQRGENGSGEQLVAYVVMGELEKEGSVTEWLQQLEERLPQYMVPSVFMVIDKMPLTASGKVYRRALPEVAASWAELGREYEGARTVTEEMLVSIWRKVLNVERVGIHDNFFELGGHSLLAARMVSFVRESFNVELPLRSLFESPTVAGLAARVERMFVGEQGLVLPPIERVERVGHLPLSYAQQRLWFLDQFEPERAVYNISHCFQLSGTLEVVLLERAFNDVLRRHESLRTIFVNGQEGPVQVISTAKKTSIPVEDLQALSEAGREAEVSRIAAKQVRAPFDLSNGPLIRVSLVRLSSEEHLLMLTLHHIVCDGWSIAVLIQELVRLYQSYSKGEAAALEELPVQYADYAVWQRQWLEGAVLEQQLEYWKQQLAGASALLSVPTDRARPPRQTFKGGRVQQSMTPELSEQLLQMSRRHGVTLFMTLLAGFQLLLGRYSGQEDVVVGTPIANRTRRELEGLIGFFANTLALRTELSGNPRFAELLGRVKEVCLGAYQHQDLPFEKLVEELQPARSLSHSPIFQVMFILQNNRAAKFEQRLANLQIKSQGVESEAAKFDLTLSVGEWEGSLHCSLEYNTDLFNEETAERLVRHWIKVLQAVSEDPAQRINEVPLLSVEERQQLLSEWNQTAVEYAREKRVHELIAEQSALRPEAIAVICQDESLTYPELNGRANQLARYLQGLGVGTETVVGICMERSVEMMVGLLAVLKAGAAYLPLDPDYPAKRLEFMMADSQAPVLLTQARLQERLNAPEQTKVVKVDHDWAEIAAESAAEVKTESEAGNLAYVIYTSGSTGEPKGVMISHGNVMNFVAGMDAVLGHEQDPGVWLAMTSISFDISVLELLWTLARGYEVVIHVGDKDSSIAALVTRHGVTHLQCTPSLATVLAADGESLRTLSSLDTLLLGGEALPTTLARQLSTCSPAAIVNMYGPTETTIWSSTYRLSGALGTIPIGSPIANTQLYVLDQHLSPAPVNVAGELYIGGEGVVRGYQQRPELTASRFIPDPFSRRAGARLYRTGDVARFRADGLVEYLGRVDQQLKLRGYRIELGEIEAVLGTHAAVKECVVVAQGEMDDQRLVAYVVMQSGQSLNESELRQHARERLPQYMVPSVFMVIDKMPLTPNGKVNRRALPEVEASRGELETEYEGPRNETEETLVSIWREVLKVERVGIHDNFFELGGHSLLATRMVSLVRESFQVELPLRSIFETPTIAGFSVTLIQNHAAFIESQELEELIAKLEQLSEEEAQTILDTQVKPQNLSRDASA